MKSCQALAALIVAFAVSLALARFGSAAEPITFTIKFPVGEIIHQTSDLEKEETFVGDNIPEKKQSMNTSIKSTLKGIKDAGDGSMVEFTYDGVKLSMTPILPQGLADELDKSLATLIGTKVVVHFTPDGRADKVDGVDAAVAKFPEGLAQAAVKQVVNDQTLKDGFNLMAEMLLPKKPVNIGEAWETEAPYAMPGMDMKFKSRVKLVAIEEREQRKIARLEFTNIKFDVAMAKGDTKFNVEKFEQSGTADFDLTRGWFTSQSFNQHLKGDVQVTVGQTQSSVKVELKMKGKCTLTPGKPEEATAESKRAATAK